MSKDINKRKLRKKSSTGRSSFVKDYPAQWKPTKPGTSFADAVQDLDSQFEKLDVLDHRNHRTRHSKQPEESKVKSYKLKIVKFQTTETIEGLGSLSMVDRPNQLDSSIKVVRKSRHSPESGSRIKMIDDTDTLTNKLSLGVIFDNWSNFVNFGVSAQAGDSNLDHECREPIKVRKSIPGGDKISSSCESNKKISKRSSFSKKPSALSSSTLIKHVYHPFYKDTVASKLRYEFRRNKKVCPYYIIQHVMKYQRPPFWNYSKISKGFGGALTRAQLQKLCDF